MNLIDRYTQEVGRNLPEKLRADIEKEIRSLIEDNLEDESQKTGRPVDEDMQVEVLKRLGRPEKVAASYLPPRYLIGPELYPHFLNTLRIVLAVVAILAALGLGTSLGAGPNPAQNVVDMITRLFAGLLDALISAAGSVVLIFAIIQLAVPNIRTIVKEEDWDPRKLLAESDPEWVSLSSVITDLVSTSLALLIFNLYPQWVGILFGDEQGVVHISLLSEAFFRYLPWLNLLWVLDIAFTIWLVAHSRWSDAHRWGRMMLTLLWMLLLAWMVSGPALLAISPENVARLGWDLGPDTVARLNQGLQTGMRAALGIVVAFQAVEIGKQLYRLFRQRLPAALISK